MTETASASLDVRNVGVLHAALETRLHGYDDFQLGCRIIAEIPAQWNELALPEAVLPGGGIGITLESTIDHELLDTTDIRITDDKLTSRVAFSEHAQARARMIGIWPADQELEFHEFAEPIGDMSFDSAYPTAEIIEQVLLDPRTPEPMAKVSRGAPESDESQEPELYVPRFFSDHTSFAFTDETRISSAQLLTPDEVPDGLSGTWARITLQGDVNIMGGERYVKVTADGTVYVSELARERYTAIRLPAELSTMLVEVPTPASQVHIKDRQLVAIEPGHEDVVDDPRSIMQLYSQACLANFSDDPLRAVYGLTALRQPALGDGAHRLVADQRGWRVSERFMDTYQTQIEARVLSSNLQAAREQASTRLQVRLAELKSQGPAEPLLRGPIAVAAHVRKLYDAA